MIDWSFTNNDQIRQIYDETGSILKTADKLGVSLEALRNHMIKEHIPFLGENATTLRYRIRAIPQCKKDSMRQVDLARLVGCSQSAIQRHLACEKK